MNSHAANASPRCALVTATSTIWSAGFERTHPMDDERIGDVPARLRVVDDRRERLFGHARIVLERHARDRRIGIDVADRADERRDRADRAIAVAQLRRAPGPHRSRRSGRVPAWSRRARPSQPPVTGGKIATSSPGADRRVGRGEVMVHGDAHRATRGELGRPHAAPPRQPGAQATPTVSTSGGASMRSEAAPKASRKRAR